MPLYVGVDDTDSLRGMCTTFLAAEIVREMDDVDLIGYPRLVRLNPNVPWKTRGNGAVCLRFGRGRGTPWRVGELGGRAVEAYPRGDALAADSVADRVALLIERWSALDEPTTNPGLVVLHRRPSPRLYWRAVREIVPRRVADTATAGRGLVRGWKNGRGVIGAAAACAWRPRDRTYEVLTYRRRAMWGRPREVDPESVKTMDRGYPSTFNNYDYAEDRIVIAPHSPCPILFGIRGDRPHVLEGAMRSIRAERPAGWLVFETNQGTDDHVASPRWPLRPYAAQSLTGTLVRPPRTIPGGHVVFRLRARGEVDATVYEPAKDFRRVARALAVGDRVCVVGSTRDSPRTINVEKLEVLRLAPMVRKPSNPRCACGKSMKSVGREAGFRCARCGRRARRGAEAMRPVPRPISTGWYEPPVGSRRHLSKPLQRMERTVVGRLPTEGPPPTLSRSRFSLPTTRDESHSPV